MKRLLNYMMFIGIATLAISCAEPEAVTPNSSKVVGEWDVEDAYVSGQADSPDLITKLVIERDGSFVYEDNNGVLTVGTWSTSETALTLTGEGEGAQTIELQIELLTYTKGHFVHNLSSPLIGEVEIRYLMNKINDGSQYGNTNIFH